MDHRELRAEMAKLGLDRVSPMEEGTLAVNGPVAPKSRAGLRVGMDGKQRRPDKRSFTVKTNTHIAGTETDKVVRLARMQDLQDRYNANLKR